MGLIAELRRRNVFRMAVLYLGAAWLVMQIVDLLIDRGPLPESFGPLMLVVLSIGFPISILLAWFYELTPDGILPDEESAAQRGAPQAVGRAMDFVVIAVLAAAVLLFAFDKWWLRDAAAPVGYANSVAVLAFEDLSPDGDQEWFSDGLTEEIINSLAQLPELKVTARTSAFHFKGKDLPIPEIAETLGVAHIVEGSVRRVGDRLRVTAQLVKADDGFHLWSESYDRHTDDVFAVQEDIAVKIASALDIYMDEGRREQMFQTGTRNVEAYEAYLRARKILGDAHFVGPFSALWEANRWYERALEHDPEFAQAHFDHADAYGHASNGLPLPPDADPDLTPEAARELSLQDMDRAIEFARNEDMRILYQAERTLVSDDWNGFRPLLDELERIRAESSLPAFMHFFNQSYTVFSLLGRSGIESNFRHITRSLEHNPLDGSLTYAAARNAIARGEYDDALKWINHFESLFGQSMGGDFLRFVLLMKTGRYEEFLKGPDTNIRGAKALALTLVGRRDEALALTEVHLQERSPYFHLAIALHELGEREEAAKIFRVLDARPSTSSNVFLTLMIAEWGGRLLWDLEWTPNYAARLAELGVELEPWEFPSPAE